MSQTVPTTAQLSTTLVSQLEASLSQTIPLLPKAALRVIAKTTSGIAVLLYKYGGFVALQLFVRTASFKETTINGKLVRPLVEWGNIIGEGDPGQGTRAQHTLTVPVVSQTGVIEAGRLYTATNGYLYRVVSSVALTAATVSVTVEAISDPDGNEGYGEGGTLPNGAKLSLVVPLANVAREATVSSTVVEGEDAELEETYRERVILRFQRRAQGGAYADYWAWARGVAGVVSAYPYASSTPGVVEVYVESNVEPDGLSGAELLSEALQAIRLDSNGKAYRCPVHKGAITRSILRTPLDVEIGGLEASDAVATLQDIANALDSWLRSREPFIEGLSVLPRKDRVTQPELAGIASGIAAASGASYTSLTLKRAGSIVNSYSVGQGEKLKLGNVNGTVPA